MQLHPRYDGEPILFIDGVADPSAALLRQRRRLLATLESLDDAQWATQSRCEEWTTQGVVTHLISTDQFWGISIAAGLRGEPTRFLATFDPVASPSRMVKDHAALTPTDVLDRYRGALDGFASAVESIAPDEWTAVVAEAPPGHLPLAAIALHALWDGWIHERDIAIPLGLALTEEDDEIALALRYVAGLGPALYAAASSGNVGTLGISTTAPALSLVVEAGNRVIVRDGSDAGPTLRGCAVDLIEALSCRAPLQDDLGPDHQWLVTGLRNVFDVQS